MAINLWKLAGRQLAYSPLPTGFANAVNLEIGEYIISFKASSISGAVLKFDSTNNTNFYVDGVQFGKSFTLSSTSTTYKISIKTLSKLTMYLVDNGNKGDIIIDNIELVQKPLPKLTINGIDSFISGKWTLHANAKVIDDSTLELNATAGFQPTNLDIACIPNMPHTLQANLTGTGIRLYVLPIDSQGVIGGAIATLTDATQQLTFTPIVSKLRLQCSNATTGKFTFTKPMLNLGTTPATYSKKTSADARMVVPVAKKNLFNFDRTLKITGLGVNTWYNPVSGVVANTASAGFPVNLKTGKTYSLSGILVSGGSFQLLNADASLVVSANTSFTPTKDETFYLRVKTATVGTVFELQDVQLEQSTYPTAYEPYAVQINAKPKRYVPKKNLFDGQLELGSIGWTNGNNQDLSTTARSKNYLAVKSGQTYILSTQGYSAEFNIHYYGNNQQWLGSPSFLQNTDKITFTTPIGCSFVRFLYKNINATQFQLEEGTTQTPYEPYTPILPRAKTGLSFDGVKDYLQLPSMTMDSIEIDCLIDAVQNNKYVLDARGGMSTGYFYTNSSGLDLIGSGFTATINGNPFVAPYPRNQRIKIKLNANAPFTDDVTIFNYNTGGAPTKGTLYKVTCYLAGSIVAQYDFENPGNIVGDKVLQNAKNLIPSFEDAKWSLHANTQVLGKDWLRLNASGGSQISYIDIPCLQSKTYLIAVNHNSAINIKTRDINNSLIATKVSGIGQTYTITTDSNAYFIRLEFTNNTTGTFDFVQPKLFQLDSKEGTLMGKPVPLNKASKRSLYSKR